MCGSADCFVRRIVSKGSFYPVLQYKYHESVIHKDLILHNAAAANATSYNFALSSGPTT